MNAWEQHFAKRISLLHTGAVNAFQLAIDEEILPAFRRMQEFLSTAGFESEYTRITNEDYRFHFALTDEIWVDVDFRLHGPTHTECLYQLHMNDVKLSSTRADLGPLPDVTEGWSRDAMERALDAFVDAIEQQISRNAASPKEQDNEECAKTDHPASVACIRPATHSDDDSSVAEDEAALAC